MYSDNITITINGIISIAPLWIKEHIVIYLFKNEQSKSRTTFIYERYVNHYYQ